MQVIKQMLTELLIKSRNQSQRSETSNQIQLD